MAKAPALPAPDGTPAKKGASLVAQLGVLLALTGVAVGAGYFAGNHLNPGGTAETHAPVADHGPAKAPPDPAAEELKRGLVMLPAITTNLAAPAQTWIRIELSAVFDGEPDATLADAVHQDLLAFLRTVKLHQIEGPSGFRHLKSDLEERARIRSEGKVSGLFFKTMLVE